MAAVLLCKSLLVIALTAMLGRLTDAAPSSGNELKLRTEELKNLDKIDTKLAAAQLATRGISESCEKTKSFIRRSFDGSTRSSRRQRNIRRSMSKEEQEKVAAGKRILAKKWKESDEEARKQREMVAAGKKILSKNWNEADEAALKEREMAAEGRRILSKNWKEPDDGEWYWNAHNSPASPEEIRRLMERLKAPGDKVLNLPGVKIPGTLKITENQSSKLPDIKNAPLPTNERVRISGSEGLGTSGRESFKNQEDQSPLKKVGEYKKFTAAEKGKAMAAKQYSSSDSE